MQDEKVTHQPITSPELPADAFILDPATYKIRGGQLEFSDSPASQKSRKYGYILLAVAFCQFLFFTVTARDTGSVALAVVFALFLGSLGWVLLRNGQRHRDLKKSSRVIVGELATIEARLVEQTIKKKRYTSNLIIATYKFTDPEGAELSGAATFERNDLINRRLPYSGTPVVVLYKNPKKHSMC